MLQMAIYIPRVSMDVELRLAEEASTPADRSASDHWLRASREGEERREGGKPVSSPIFFLALPARLGIGRRADGCGEACIEIIKNLHNESSDFRYQITLAREGGRERQIEASRNDVLLVNPFRINCGLR